MKTNDIILLGAGFAAGRLSNKLQAGPIGATEGNPKDKIKQIAGKLLSEGLTPSTYTKQKAKNATKNVVVRKFVHKMIDMFSPEIKAEMKKMK